MRLSSRHTHTVSKRNKLERGPCVLAVVIFSSSPISCQLSQTGYTYRRKTERGATIVDPLPSVSSQLVLNLAFAPSWVLLRLLMKLEYFLGHLNARILASTSVLFRPTTVQMPSLALIKDKRIKSKVFFST